MKVEKSNDMILRYNVILFFKKTALAGTAPGPSAHSPGPRSRPAHARPRRAAAVGGAAPTATCRRAEQPRPRGRLKQKRPPSSFFVVRTSVATCLPASPAPPPRHKRSHT